MTACRSTIRSAMGVAGFALALFSACSALGATDPFLADCRALTTAPHRLTGTTEYRAAADYVERRLKAIGADRVLVQRFPAAQTHVRRCEIEVAVGASSERVRRALLPMRPNGIVPPVTPPGGIRGRIRHFRTGELSDLKNQRSPRGAIVVLDYNDARAWLQAFRLGARAVVFVAKGEAQAWQAHYTESNANLPRFYYAGPRADLSEGAEAVIHSEIVWRDARGRNVFAFFRGTRARFDQNNEEVILLAAHLDSFGEVPRRAPGARGAVNCAGLLKIAEHLKANRPRRHVLLAFFDAQARGHAGVAAFYRALEDEAYVRIRDRTDYLKAERAFLADLRHLLAQKDPLGERSSVERKLVDRLKRGGKAHAYDANDILYELNLKESRLPDSDPERAALRGLIEKWKADKDGWNSLRRALVRKKKRLYEQAAKELAQALDEVRRDVGLRGRELDLEEQSLDDDRRLKELVGRLWISLHTSLALGDATDYWGLVIGGDSSRHAGADQAGLYAKVQGTFLSAVQALKDAAPAHFERASADGTLDPPRLLWGAPFLIHSGEVAGKLGIFNLVLATTQEGLGREGTPDDTLARLDLGRLERQIGEVAALLAAVADEPGLSLRRQIEPQKLYVVTEFGSDDRPHGPAAVGRSMGSAVQDRPMPGVTIQLLEWPKNPNTVSRLPFRPIKPYAFDDFLVLRTNRNGSFDYGPVHRWRQHHRGFAIHTDPRGVVVAASDLTSAKTPHTRLNMFNCRSGAVALPTLASHRAAQLLRAKTNSRLDDAKCHYATWDGVVHWFVERKVEGVKLFHLESVVGLVSGPDNLAGLRDRSDPEGVGFPMTDAWEPFSVARRSATDLWRLNESRIQLMRERGLMNSSIEELHGHAEDLLIAADKARSVAAREAFAASAFMAERPVYHNSRSTLDDLVRAVLVLLALSVPFSFALERLLVGATSIYRQIIWFVVFFTATFLLLFLTHPAFAVSKTPIIIFLGFAVVVLASLVIVIIMRRFEAELKVLQGLTTTVHAADVSRFSTIMAAMSMGISTMRRRPLRTALTATTIIMLTFTILCFASFGTQTGIVKLFAEASPGYSGVYLHKVNWAALNPDLLDVLEGRWGESAAVCCRWWRAPRTEQQKGPLLTRADGSHPLAITGVLGIEDEELAHRGDLAGVLRVGDNGLADTVLMTRAVAEHLGVSAGDTVIVGCIRLRVGTLLDASLVATARDMDGSGILPVDFVEMRSALGDPETPERALAVQSEQNWAYLPTDSVVVVSADNAQKMGAQLHAVSLYPRGVRSATELAEDLARIFPIPVAATRADGVYRHVLGTVVEASGAGDLLFPIVLGGLVIFGTMLGSVEDRGREIYTFSSLGLAPPHVASLFFAEAMVYSVLGGLAGYLIAQGSLAALGKLAEYGLVRVPEMNYSSTNAIVTILIVMATVLVSAIYPALKASKSANPGILRTWRLPPPDGDVFDIAFPFTVSEYDITGVVSFLKEHFENFGDTGLGLFMATDPRLVSFPRPSGGDQACPERSRRGEGARLPLPVGGGWGEGARVADRPADAGAGGRPARPHPGPPPRGEGAHSPEGGGRMIGLAADLSLAPFDLGVTQRFELRSAPSEIPGIDEVKIKITRKSGQPKDWQRLNKVLLDDLRRQFLIWRALPTETMESYRHRTLAEMGAGPSGHEPPAHEHQMG